MQHPKPETGLAARHECSRQSIQNTGPDRLHPTDEFIRGVGIDPMSIMAHRSAAATSTSNPLYDQTLFLAFLSGHVCYSNRRFLPYSHRIANDDGVNRRD